MTNLLAVFIGGGLGSVLRYGISLLVQQHFKTFFPLATLLSNLLSCLILAITIGYFYEKISDQPFVKLMLIVGFCGGFSTFSTFSFETVELFRSVHFGYAIANILISVGVCTGIVYFLVK